MVCEMCRCLLPNLATPSSTMQVTDAEGNAASHNVTIDSIHVLQKGKVRGAGDVLAAGREDRPRPP
jgi:uncharacterized Zn ribbon protein